MPSHHLITLNLEVPFLASCFVDILDVWNHADFCLSQLFVYYIWDQIYCFWVQTFWDQKSIRSLERDLSTVHACTLHSVHWCCSLHCSANFAHFSMCTVHNTARLILHNFVHSSMCTVHCCAECISLITEVAINPS